MKAIIGLAMAGVGIPVGIWALKKAMVGQNGYNWVWLVALFLGSMGIMVLIAQFKNWANS
jgi:hypothetical protein